MPSTFYCAKKQLEFEFAGATSGISGNWIIGLSNNLITTLTTIPSGIISEVIIPRGTSYWEKTKDSEVANVNPIVFGGVSGMRTIKSIYIRDSSNNIWFYENYVPPLIIPDGIQAVIPSGNLIIKRGTDGGLIATI